MAKEKIDPKYIGVPNIQFSLTDKNDPREKKFIKQRIKRGFDDSETWSLRDTISNFIIPRLQRYIEMYSDFGGSHLGGFEDNNLEELNKKEIEILNKILKAFQLVSRNEGILILTDDEQKEYEEGIKLFSEYFLTLWW